MQKTNFIWIYGLAATLIVILLPLAIFLPEETKVSTDPWENLPQHPIHTDHSSIIQGPFETGQDVTKACLKCHENAAHEVMQTPHWTWESEPYEIEGRNEPVTIGKKNQLNNFCIGIQGNWTGCTRCHIGYGWDSAEFDFSNEESVDCLACHDTSGGYVKGGAGLPVEGVDLLSSAQSVGIPTRKNCGDCHFNGGGGNAVKHGDMDSSLYYPQDDVDIHMGKNDFLCIDCHRTEDHLVTGRSISVSLDDKNQIACTDCHNNVPHQDERINSHIDAVACQTCHIPTGATRDSTKVYWDWSTAGSDDIEENAHEYLKIKGSFVYESDLIPEYYWYNGSAERYLLGDTMNPEEITSMNKPLGNIDDASAKIFPFKVHRGKQPYDTLHNYFLQPKTVGEGGYWTDFDWDQALRLGSEIAGMEYSGEYDFAETEMFWPTTHMVVPAEQALTCGHCHGEEGRMDWEALGYYGDPIDWGGRFSANR
ncbi:MAG: tetrathionate reductase family octaheme c-type cytochrome [Chloroflexi bacterium]|nr:tetrathionate reductase family octaheme c-type cytochrome [Chloroflexota bacterium]